VVDPEDEGEVDIAVMEEGIVWTFFKILLRSERPSGAAMALVANSMNSH